MAKTLTLEITEGITEHSNRVALKGVFQAFGDVLACWVPPVDRRGLDNASVRFAAQSSADAAKQACDNGQVFFQGIPVKVIFRTGSGPRVGNSDIGDRVGGNSPQKQRSRSRNDSRRMALENASDRRKRSRSRSRRRRRSRSRGRRSRSRRDEKGRSRDRDKFNDEAATTAAAIAAVNAALPDGAPKVESPDMAQALAALPMNAAGVPPWVSYPGQHMAALPPAPFVPEEPQPTPEELEAEMRRREDVRKARSAAMKRGPGVAALVQGALKNVTVLKKQSDKDDAHDVEKNMTMEEQERARERERQARIAADKASRMNAAAQSESEKKAKRREVLKLSSKGEWLTIDPETGAEKKVDSEKEKAEREKIRHAREEEERKARERKEKQEREAAEADAAKKEEERKRREERVRAGIEAAKKQQIERKRAAQKEDADFLYGEMPEPDPDELEAANEARKREEKKRQEMNFSHLPAEDISKVIFLDIDGVMRPARAGGFDIVSEGEMSVRPDTSDFFPSAMKALSLIVQRTGAVIVLSSEWRRTESLRQAVDNHLMANQLRPCHGTTRLDKESEPSTSADPVRAFAERRGLEICAWLMAHDTEVKSWVVLDDINLGIADEEAKPGSKPMASKLVQTWPLCGLTTGNAKTAVRILRGEMINKVLVERPKMV